jgi:glycosyltransferase involved in cell wall biosynthesis
MLAISRSVVRASAYRRTAIVPTTSLSTADLTGPAGRSRPFPAGGARIRLLFTGRLVEEKGLLELGEALASLVAAGHNVEVEIVGAAYGDTTIDLMLSRAQAAGVADRIIVSGFLEAGPDLLAAYDRADIYVLPTYGEGAVSRTVKEAFARGLPVVTTAIPQHVEFLDDGVQAVLVQPQSAPALADGISRVISDASLRGAMADRAFAFVQDYTNERSAELVAEHIRAEIARHRSTESG